MNKLVFATNNLHKLEEISQMIGDKFTLVSLHEIGCQEDIEETAETIEGNALLKAQFVHEKFGYDCFADDTGLEVEALQGRPGVYSARYADEAHNFEANMDKVLDELKGSQNRKARFRTVIALIHDGQEFLFEGIVHGIIIESRRGITGFGYDPVFVPDGYNQTFAEMSLLEKNRISHRAIAVEKLISFLKIN